MTIIVSNRGDLWKVSKESRRPMFSFSWNPLHTPVLVFNTKDIEIPGLCIIHILTKFKRTFTNYLPHLALILPPSSPEVHHNYLPKNSFMQTWTFTYLPQYILKPGTPLPYHWISDHFFGYLRQAGRQVLPWH